MDARRLDLDEPLGAAEVAHLLREVGQRLELTGDVPHRARAYYRAAENLLTVSEPLDRLIAENRLREIPGVGPAIAEKIIAFHRAARHGERAYGLARERIHEAWRLGDYAERDRWMEIRAALRRMLSR